MNVCILDMGRSLSFIPENGVRCSSQKHFICIWLGTLSLIGDGWWGLCAGRNGQQKKTVYDNRETILQDGAEHTMIVKRSVLKPCSPTHAQCYPNSAKMVRNILEVGG